MVSHLKTFPQEILFKEVEFIAKLEFARLDLTNSCLIFFFDPFLQFLLPLLCSVWSPMFSADLFVSGLFSLQWEVHWPDVRRELKSNAIKVSQGGEIPA